MHILNSVNQSVALKTPIAPTPSFRSDLSVSLGLPLLSLVFLQVDRVTQWVQNLSAIALSFI